ncbi:uncharacterized protein LOC144702920 isoform X2 [Wolffia australiana]
MFCFSTMGGYDSSGSREVPFDREDGNLTERIGALGISDSPMDSLVQVIRAVEDAEIHIKQQLEENNRLRDELMQKTRELEKYKSDAVITLRSSGATRSNLIQESRTNSSSILFGNGDYRSRWMHNSSSTEHQDGKMDGSAKFFPPHQSGVDNSIPSRFSSPSSRSLSPNRQQKDAECSKLSSCGHGLMQVSERNGPNSLLKQDLLAKIKELNEEISQLRRHLSDFSVKETQILNEKYVLEKRIAHMRLAFDQQQQDLVDAASKALSYRQEIIEENIRLSYALQEAQQEKSTFVSSLMPLLVDYNFQPSVPDAMSIASNLKVLFKHLQEKLLIAEEKLKDSQYQLSSWHAEPLNSFPQSPLRPVNPLNVANAKTGLEIVPQHSYPHEQSPMPSPSRAETRPDWDGLGQESNPISSSTDALGRKVEHEPTIKSSTASSSNNQQLMKSNDVEDSDNGRPRSVDEGPPYHRYLPPVMEEPGSSLSEAEDDPLPAIEGLQINGEAFPGNQLQACGFSINGTTHCNFEWVRYREDGSLSYIEGAMQPAYLVTADDVDCFLAIEIQPLDDRKRKGEIVKVFANEQRRISCDDEMQEEIAKIYHAGQMSFPVSLSAGALNIWENAILAIKREGYSIKASGTRGVIVAEKFSPSIQVTIINGYMTEFFIQNSSGVEHMLKASNSRERDMIVLTLRLFIKGAVEKKKGKKKVLFF